MKKNLLILLMLLVGINSYATHIVGGNMAYTYLGDTDGDGNYNYKITFQTFLDCNSPYWLNGFPEPTLDIGIYEGTSSPSGNLFQTITVTMPLVDSNSIVPTPTNGCTIGQTVCLYQATYEAEVDLPLSFQGYHLFYDRCCRTGSVINLNNPGDQGLVFHAYIAPTLVNNSSPVFSDVPVPFLCVNDTTSILNTATDPDGDLLLFSFVDPYRGFGNSTNPAPPLPNPLSWPIPNVNWLNASYNQNNPFGPSGYAFIDGVTGLTQYMAPAIGDYVVAIEIREMRNGNLIGITRRDIQLVVINCPPNPPPNLSATGGSGTTQYTISECDTLSFPVTFTDPNGDSLTLSTSGQIFDTSYVNPAATIDSLVIGDSTVTANFNWQTSCGTAQALPYLFTVSTTDNGCPPKTTNVVYQVTVDPPTPPDSIVGLPLVCQNSYQSYSVDTISGFTFNWTVTNGTIISGQGSTTINTNWPNVGTGTISVNAISDCGCPSASIDTAITIIPSPPTDAGLDTNVCLGDTIQIGGNPTGPLGTTFLWTPNTNMNNNTIANPLVWPTITTNYIVVVDNGTCSSTDTITVTVGSATIDAGLDTSFCLGDSTQLNAVGGIIYAWSPSVGLSDTSIANPIASPIVTTTYFVTVTDSAGCVGTDSVVVTVNTAPVITLTNDTTICAGACVQLNAFGGTNYNWSPGIGLSDSTISNPIACPLVNTNYILTVSNGNNCSNTDSVFVIVGSPITIATNNDTAVCNGVCVQLNAAGGVSYIWTPNTGLSNNAIANPLACPSATTMYIVTGTNASGCSGTDTVTITVNPPPTVDAGVDQGICIGNSALVGGSPTGPVGSSYSWAPSATLDNGTIANPTATPIVTTQYIVTVTDINGCINIDTVLITVNLLPVVDAGNDTTICEGVTLTIGGSPTGSTGSTYNWLPAGSLNNNILSNPLSTPLITTEYIVTVTDLNSCVSIDSVVITVNSSPPVATGNDTALCIGNCAQLNASGGTSYVWTPSAGLSNNTIANPVACPTVNTNYIVTGTDANGCFDTSSTTVSINPLPTIPTNNDTALCLGSCVQLSAAGGTNYLWSPGTTLTDSTIFNPIACPIVTTIYVVTVTDSNSCSDTASLMITINPLPVVDAGVDTSICVGDSTQLNAIGAVSYVWTPNTNISNITIANPIIFPTVTTTYFVTGTDANGCVDVDSAVVTVNTLPIITTSNDTALCLGDCTQLNASGGTNYLWTPGGSLSDSTIFNPIACPINNTIYIVTVTNANNCFDTASVNVIINPLPVINAGPDLWLCTGDSIQLSAMGGVSYLWTPSLGLNDTTIANPMAAPLINTNYIVVGIDVNGCSSNDTMLVTVNNEVPIDPGSDTTICVGDSVVLGGAPTSPNGTSYSWFPSGTLNNDTLSNPTAFPIVTTTYYVVATNDTCTAIDSITITINPPPNINAGVDIDICIGDSAQLNATGGISYLWQPSSLLTDSTIFNPIGFPTDTTEFIVYATDINGCSTYDSVIVNVNSLPTISAGVSTSVCSGDTVQLNATGGISYLWTPSLGLSDTTIANPMAYPLIATTYTVIGTDIMGCSNSDSILVSVLQLNVPDLSDTIICIGETLQFTVYGPPGATYLWSPSTDLSNTTISNPVTSTLITITYLVTVTDTNGCIDTTSILVTAEPKPISNFTVETSLSCEGISADFANLSTGSSSYLWDFGNGEQSSEINPTHIFAYGSSTTVILTSYSSGLCSDTSSYPITASNFEEYFNIVPPTVLTPNRDGLNDLFKLDLPSKISNCTNIQIFNRWGMKVYESYGQNSGWDGRTTTGTKVPDGTYFYIIDIKGITKKGSLTLMK